MSNACGTPAPQLATRGETFAGVSPWLMPFVQQSSEPLVFALSQWNEPWWRLFGAGTPLLLTVHSEQGLASSNGQTGRNTNPLLFAAMQIADGEARFMGGSDLVDLHDFIYPATVTGKALEDALAQVLTLVAARADVSQLTLTSLPADSPTVKALANVTQQLPLTMMVKPEDVAPHLVLPTTWDGYVASLSKKQRHELRRKLRRLYAAGKVQFKEVTDPAEVVAHLDDFLRLHKMSTPEKAQFMTPKREAFVREVATDLATEGITRLCCLKFNEELVAASLCFVYGDTKYLYNSGYNPQYGHLTVGLLGHALNIQATIEEGLRVFDFLRGNEQYKYNLGGQDRQLVTVTIIPSGSPNESATLGSHQSNTTPGSI